MIKLKINNNVLRSRQILRVKNNRFNLKKVKNYKVQNKKLERKQCSLYNKMIKIS